MAATATHALQDSGVRFRTQTTSGLTAGLTSATNTKVLEVKAETSGSLAYSKGFSQTEVKELPEVDPLFLATFKGVQHEGM